MSKMSPFSAPMTKYQEALDAECRSRNWCANWEIYSDRRGGRTAWSAMVTVEGHPFPARLWYDGDHIYNAREEAAKFALETIYGSPGAGAVQQHQGHQQVVSSTAARW